MCARVCVCERVRARVSNMAKAGLGLRYEVVKQALLLGFTYLFVLSTTHMARDQFITPRECARDVPQGNLTTQSHRYVMYVISRHTPWKQNVTRTPEQHYSH
jgi:hypothetical protein